MPSILKTGLFMCIDNSEDRDRLNSYIHAIKQFPVFDTLEFFNHPDDTMKRDVFTLFADGCDKGLINAGFTTDTWKTFQDPVQSLEKRWLLLKPHWEKIKLTGYARTITKVFNTCFNLNEVNYHNICLVQEILDQEDFSSPFNLINQYGIKGGVICTQDFPPKFLTEKNWQQAVSPDWLFKINNLEELDQFSEWVGFQKIRDFPKLLVFVNFTLHHLKRLGMQIIHIQPPCLTAEPDQPGQDSRAKSSFQKLVNQGKISNNDSGPLQGLLLKQILQWAHNNRQPIQISSGYSMNGKFTFNLPRYWSGLFQSYPSINHCFLNSGYPHWQELSMVARAHSNAFIELGAFHVISPESCQLALTDWLSSVPENKIFGFGGHLHLFQTPELAIGQLEFAIENIANTMLKAEKSGVITQDQGLDIAKNWLWDNPANYYGIGKSDA